ncbi:MAG: three-Cys-motif partner protein TcmP [Chloroflexota bacterium]|nr:three-Cys-motif partner protein TcmP [Chloroflexota bacterium]
MAVKHSILTYYLKIWVPHLAKTRRPLAYVDGFAGRGIYPGGELGSPLLALKVMADYAGRIDPSQRFDCYFVEKDDDNFGNMQAAVIAHPAVVGGWVRPHFFRDTFQSASQQIIRAIRLKDQPSFVFADQFGYSHAPMSVLGEVLRLPKAELLVNVMSWAALWGLSCPDVEETLDSAVGSPDWRALVDLHGLERERGLIDLYCRELKRRDAQFTIPFRMGFDDRDRTLYYLVHATKHVKGASLMKQAMVASGSRSELGYAGETRHRMSPLFNLDADNLPVHLLRRFAGQTLTFSDVVARTIEETGTCVEVDYRRCLKQLDRDGVIKVQRVSTVRGLDKDDRIMFPLAVGL